MRRREFFSLLGGVTAWPVVAAGQQNNTARQVRIGVIAAAPPTDDMLKAFRDGMRARGYVEGQNLAIEVHWPRGTFDQDPSTVSDLVKANVDVIVALGDPDSHGSP